ncbi:Uma2 family endonuclease [Synechococcus sp. PCC 7336]|uniref:Uma2 family endonuclease n=1 Tax=Synechococcus sp. PCC 7336 TaxID=195250 RepID=UPI0003475EA8|nr:Uma2 family endonuclease [Synechococcus sp. PCC 7336]
MVAVKDSMSFAEYLEWEAQQDWKHEYIDGQVYAMAGGTLAHSLLASKLITALGVHLDGKPCQVFSPDAKVCISESGPCFYPDVSVTCHQQDLAASDYLQFPCLIVEILSPSTEKIDRGKKRLQYQRIATLQDYVLVSSETQRVEIYRRTNHNTWEYTLYELGDTLQFSSIDLALPLDRLYENVVLVPESEAS